MEAATGCGLYGDSLLYLFTFSVNLKLFLKIMSIKKTWKVERPQDKEKVYTCILVPF